VTPFHVGLERWIHFEKREFVGREALLRVQEQGVEMRWVGMTLEGAAPANAGDIIHALGDVATQRTRRKSGAEAGDESDGVTRGAVLGRVTSSALGHSVGKTLALGYLRTTHAWPGSRVLVQSAGRPVLATVTPTPFFDPTGARLRAKSSDAPRRDQEG